MRSLCFAWLVGFAMACSGSHKPAAPAAPADPSSGCEPGRCLEDISQLVKERRPEARACYDAATQQNPALPAGRVIINFRIDASGAVSETSQGMQDDQLADEGLAACLGDVIEKITFAKSATGKATRAYHEFQFAKR